MPIKITMFLGSLDHTPSEQLGDLEQWHTTVLILSEGGQHWDLAREIIKILGLRNDRLSKWGSGRRPSKYKEKFEQAFFERLDNYPVYIRAISAQGKTIKDSFNHMLAELRIWDNVISIARNGKPYLQFNKSGITYELPEIQGIPLVFICHYLLRMHQEFLPLIQINRPNIEWIDWQISPNKFPGDVNGPMANVFNAIMHVAPYIPLVNGTMRILTFNESREDLGSALADNIAGLLTDKLVSGDKQIGAKTTCQEFGWEVWLST